MLKHINASMAQQIEDLQALLRIPSMSRGAAAPGMPLGESLHEALTYTLSLANRLGFSQTQSLDGFCGTVDYGDGAEMLGILVHLDVVPEGEGWTYPPFGAEIHDGRLYSRGVLDNKSSAVSALYALAAIRDAGLPLSRRVRIIFGCDEEAGWACMDRYKQTEPIPDLAFSPDAEYPVVYAERGILQARYEKPFVSSLRIDCGTAANVIPGTACAKLPAHALPCLLPPGLSAVCEENILTVIGCGGHASMPEFAHNALQGLLKVLTEQELPPEDAATIRALDSLFGMDQHGERMRLDFSDDSGRLSLVPTILQVNETVAALEMDCRYPLSLSADDLLKQWDSLFGAIGFVRTNTQNKSGHSVPVNSELVTKLMKVYTEHVGRNVHPLAIGGGTYARAFPNAVGFGPVREDEPSQCHMPNESMSLADIHENTILLAKAICVLAGESETTKNHLGA